MAAPKVTDQEFIDLYRIHGTTKLAKLLDQHTRSVADRRARIEKKHKIQLAPIQVNPEEYPGRLSLNIDDGTVLIGSDAHYWPGPKTLAHEAFVQFCQKLRPSVVVMNGDVLDGASISRHPPIGWEKKPSLAEEMETVDVRLSEIVKSSPSDSLFIWNLGNHDLRYDSKIAALAPEYANIHGVTLSDHFPKWKFNWSTWINDDVVIKHRFKSGVHATHNNTMWAGKSMVTGHLHSLKVMPFSDYNGTRYGVDSGTLTDFDGPQFVYCEDNPRNWRSGFVVLTFQAGRLLMPEICLVHSSGFEFRGKFYPRKYEGIAR